MLTSSSDTTWDDDMTDIKISIMRGPAVVARRGDSRSRMYRDIDAGTWTPPVALGPRLAGWPAHEVDALLRARVAGATVDELRELVHELLAQRAQMWPRRHAVQSHDSQAAVP